MRATVGNSYPLPQFRARNHIQHRLDWRPNYWLSAIIRVQSISGARRCVLALPRSINRSILAPHSIQRGV